MSSTDTTLATSYINEYPHPAFIVHYHPDSGQFHLGYVQEALDKQVSAIELDLRYRSSDKQVVCNHDTASAQSPTLIEVIDLVLGVKGTSQTLYDTGYQFFLVLEPKQDSDVLLDDVRKILEEYAGNWSTSASPGSGPRGITVVITGDYKDKFYERLPADEKATLCIVEERDYPDVVGLSASGSAFKWRNFKDENAKGEINRSHENGFNTRIYGASDLKRSFACGSDSVNCNLDRIDECKAMLLNQNPRGLNPALAVRGSRVAVAWRGEASNYIYTSVGTMEADGPRFTRQVLMTWLLEKTPEGFAPSLTFDRDGTLLTVYQGTAESRLWYMSGGFSHYDRYLTFAGGEHRLTTADDKRRGTNPSVALEPDERLVIVYTGTTDSQLWYFTGRLNGGILEGDEYRLTTKDNKRRGTNPAVAISATGQVIVIYEGRSDQKIWYVTGTLNDKGEIVGDERQFTWGTGYTPFAAFDPAGRILIVYRTETGARLSYVYGTVGGDGAVDGKQFSLTTPGGYTPAAAFDDAGKVTIIYRGTSDEKILYVHGSIDPGTGFSGSEQVLNMSFDRW
ncbi:MAG: hypothetical protein ACJ754_07145 [Pyrinomonadaceae bacterium]